MSDPTTGEGLLAVKELRTCFYGNQGRIPAVDGVSFTLNSGKTLCLVGESGCGKTVTALSIMRLINPPARIVGGEILLEGEDLLKKSKEAMRKIRGKEISMIFQEPMTSLNPVFTIGDQIAEAIRIHQRLNKRKAMVKATEMLQVVGIPDPDHRVKEYPHQLSGGMQQRAMIAMALSSNLKVLIADEPTTALDVTIQAQILDLIRRLQNDMATGVILITHDLDIVAEMADEVAVMYTGKIVEQGDKHAVLDSPAHSYTRGLLASIPQIDGAFQDRLHTIPGVVPSLGNLPRGCYFSPRCFNATETCRKSQPELRQVGDNHYCRCWAVEGNFQG